MKYVGETGQQFHNRKQQHQRDVKNRVSTNGIDREPHFMRRKQQTLAGTNLTAKLEKYYDCDKYTQMPFPEK